MPVPIAAKIAPIPKPVSIPSAGAIASKAFAGIQRNVGSMGLPGSYQAPNAPNAPAVYSGAVAPTNYASSAPAAQVNSDLSQYMQNAQNTLANEASFAKHGEAGYSPGQMTAAMEAPSLAARIGGANAVAGQGMANTGAYEANRANIAGQGMADTGAYQQNVIGQRENQDYNALVGNNLRAQYGAYSSLFGAGVRQNVGEQRNAMTPIRALIDSPFLTLHPKQGGKIARAALKGLPNFFPAGA